MIETGYLGETEALLARPVDREPFSVDARHLRSVLEGAAPGLRKALISAALGKQLPRWGRRRLGPLVVASSDYGTRWSIERRAGPLWADAAADSTERACGGGVLTLIAQLSGVSLGTLCSISLHILGLELSLSDFREIQTLIDRRAASSPEDRQP